jgi:hypothetical protein
LHLATHFGRKTHAVVFIAAADADERRQTSDLRVNTPKCGLARERGKRRDLPDWGTRCDATRRADDSPAPRDVRLT